MSFQMPPRSHLLHELGVHVILQPVQTSSTRTSPGQNVPSNQALFLSLLQKAIQYINLPTWFLSISLPLPLFPSQSLTLI